MNSNEIYSNILKANKSLLFSKKERREINKENIFALSKI